MTQAEVSSDNTKGGSVGIKGMRLWKEVTVVVSGDDRQFASDGAKTVHVAWAAVSAAVIFFCDWR